MKHEWDRLKHNGKSWSENYKTERKYKGRWYSFWEATDNSFRRFFLYRWYWEFIWCRISRVWFKLVEQPLTHLKVRVQRFKRGFARSDAWAASEAIFEYSYNVLKQFVEDEWGFPPEFVCETHNKAMYDDIMKFLNLYEIWHNMVTSHSLENINAQIANYEHEQEIKCDMVDAYGNLIVKHWDSLWT